MIHPDTKVQYLNEKIGWGVFSTSFIPKGTIVYVKDELELTITPQQFAKLDNHLQQAVEKYSYLENQGNRIVSWDHAKYVNHCCDCNTMSTGYGFEIAIKNIYPDDEITDEYGLFNVKEKMNLTCEKSGCRGCIQPSDIDQYFRNWDSKVKSALTEIMEVEQPLISLLDLKTVERLVNFLSNQDDFESVKNLKLRV